MSFFTLYWRIFAVFATEEIAKLLCTSEKMKFLTLCVVPWMTRWTTHPVG